MSQPDRNDAHHEAGHAVAAVVYGIGLISVDIRAPRVPGGGIGRGGTNFEMFPENEIFGQGEKAVLPYLITFFAGVFGEQRVNPSAGLETGPNSDGFRVMKYASGAICAPVQIGTQFRPRQEDLQRNQARITACMEAGRKGAEEFAVKYGAAIDAVADELLAKQVLSAAQVEAIVAAHPPK